MDNYLILRQNCLEIAPLKHNGPAIKLVGVPEYSRWRIFCRQVTNFAEQYECRVTSFWASRL